MPEQKKVLINASTAAIGGGLLVATDIIRALCSNPEYSVLLICPPVNAYKKLEADAEKIFVPAWVLKFYTRWWLDYFWLKRKIKALSPHVVITLGNLPAICKAKQIMFNDNAFVSEQSLKGFHLTKREYIVHSVRKKVFRNRLKYIDLLLVQTLPEKEKFEKTPHLKIPETKIIAPLFPSHLMAKADSKKIFPYNKPTGTIRLGCISYVYGHKNIGILIDVLQLAKDAGFPLQIIFTLSPVKSVLSRTINKNLIPFIKSGNAINLKKVRAEFISSLISELDGLILPTLIETYGLNTIEALFFQKPLFISDRPFARKICRENAIYFDPLDPHDIFNKIKAYFSTEKADIKLYKKKPVSKIIPIGTPEELYKIIDEVLK